MRLRCSSTKEGERLVRGGDELAEKIPALLFVQESGMYQVCEVSSFFRKSPSWSWAQRVGEYAQSDADDE